MSIQSFLLCLLFILSLHLPQVVSGEAIPSEHSGIALISSEYVDSKILFITSADGKLYAYDMEKHSLKWLADINVILQRFIADEDMRLDDHDFILLPSRDGKIHAYSPSSGFEKYEKDEIREGIQACFNPGKTKYFSKVQEKFLLLDLNKGEFWNLDEGITHVDPAKMENYGVMKIKEYKYSAFDFQSVKEKWSLISCDINFYTYFQFLNEGSVPNPQKMSQNYNIACKSGNIIEISRAKDGAFLRSIETEEEVIGVHSLDPNGGFIRLQVEIIEELALQENRVARFLRKKKKKAKIPSPCEQNASQGIVVYSENKEDYEDAYCTPPSGSSEIEIAPSKQADPILNCIKVHIDKKKAIELAECRPQASEGEIILYQVEEVYAKTESKYNNPMFVGLVFGSMMITAIISIIIERKLKIRNKKSISTEIDPNVIDTSSNKSNESTNTPPAKASKSNATTAEPSPQQKDKKTKKRDFEIFTKEILGMGSQGTVVFQGEFQGKNIAVKRFQKIYVDLAKSEINLLMHIDHPNIIRYYLFEEDKEFIYLILERCVCSMKNFVEYFNRGDKAKEKDNDEAANSKSIINYRQAIRKVFKEKQMSPEMLKKLILDCANGLHYLHKTGVVHRDIKPENILVSQNLEAKLADFGISKKLTAEDEKFLTEAGSFGWKAPEMFNKLDLKSKAVDIFSLGCTFYYIYTKGSHPFGELHEREMNILNNKYKMDYLKDFDLEHLIKNMIKVDPEERYTIDDVLNHSYFWDDARKLGFMQELSDFIESTDPQLGKMFEEYCQIKQAVPIPWAKALDQFLIKDLTSYRFYDFKSVKELLRVIRNKKNHYYELPEEARLALGKMPTGVWSYFNSRFPRLFMHAYIFCKDNNVELSLLA